MSLPNPNTRLGVAQPLPPRSAGRPRDQRAHRAILDATRDVARENGYGGVTIEGVARRAGVAKTTIYRWWRGKSALVYEACFGNEDAGTSAPDTGDLYTDLRALVRLEVGRQTAPLARMVLPGLVAEQAESSAETPFLEGLLQPERARVQSVVDGARRRGENVPSGAVELLVDMLSGAVFHHAFVLGKRPDEEFETALTGRLVQGLRP